MPHGILLGITKGRSWYSLDNVFFFMNILVLFLAVDKKRIESEALTGFASGRE